MCHLREICTRAEAGSIGEQKIEETHDQKYHSSITKRNPVAHLAEIRAATEERIDTQKIATRLYIQISNQGPL